MLELATKSLVAMLVTVDPLALVPMFVAITAGADAAQRRALAHRGVAVGGAVLLLFAVAGDRIMQALGIGMPAFRVAGGLFLFLLALEMVFDRRSRRRSSTAEEGAAEGPAGDVAVFPLGVPLIAGPAAITTVILAADQVETLEAGLLTILAPLTLCMLLTWLALLLAGGIERLLGHSLINVLTRLLGMLLGALAVQFVIDGLGLVGS